MAHSNSINQQGKAIMASMDLDYWLCALMTLKPWPVHYSTPPQGGNETTSGLLEQVCCVVQVWTWGICVIPRNGNHPLISFFVLRSIRKAGSHRPDNPAKRAGLKSTTSDENTGVDAVSCQTCVVWPVPFTADSWPSYCRYWCETNDATAQKVICSQTIHRIKWVNVFFQSEARFITCSICDEPSTRHIISILKDQTLQFETVSVTLWSNQERWWRLPFIWVDNLGRTRRST